jgi:hypothetical protein
MSCCPNKRPFKEMTDAVALRPVQLSRSSFSAAGAELFRRSWNLFGAAADKYDLILKGGRVIDPHHGSMQYETLQFQEAALRPFDRTFRKDPWRASMRAASSSFRA